MKNLILALATIFIFASSCKKKEDDAAPTTPSPVVNTPPSSDYFFGSLSTTATTKAIWSADLATYPEFTNEFKNHYAYAVNVCGSKVIMALMKGAIHTVAYADLSDLKSFSEITSERSLTDVAILNGVIVACAVDGNNTYSATCNTNNGETKLTFSLLPAGTTIMSLKLVGSNIIGSVLSTGLLLGYTTDGQWTITSHPFTADGNYEYFDSKTWCFSGNKWAYNTGSDFTTGWVMDTLYSIDANTTDTNGTFEPCGNMIATDDKWLLYGTIYAGATSGKRYPCVNVSTDNGVNWTTSFLGGISGYTNNVSWATPIHATNAIIVIDNRFGSEFPAGIYSSADGINFTLWTDEAQSTNFKSIATVRTVK